MHRDLLVACLDMRYVMICHFKLTPRFVDLHVAQLLAMQVLNVLLMHVNHHKLDSKKEVSTSIDEDQNDRPQVEKPDSILHTSSDTCRGAKTSPLPRSGQTEAVKGKGIKFNIIIIMLAYICKVIAFQLQVVTRQ